MNQGSKWLKLFLASLLAGSLALAGCSGDDGDAGPMGPAGPAGPPGTDATAGIAAPQTSETSQCVTCHSTIPGEVLTQNPYRDEITERFLTSRHANQHARNGFCSACHSHEGGQELLAMGRFTNRADLVAAYTADLAVYNLPVGSSTIVGVTEKTCSTCHMPSGAHMLGAPALRGDGDVLDADGSVVFSAEFNLCTACHMVDVDATLAGHGDAGNLYEYTLSAQYTAANLIDATSGTYNMSKAPFYHDGASGNGRTLVDTHFKGQILSHLVSFDGGASDVTLAGYNINAGSPNPCTICHDPHTAGKMLSVDSGSTIAYADRLDNKVVSYAEGLGAFHTNHLGAAQGHGCIPCHSGNDLVPLTLGATIVGNPSGTSAIGCRTCHDLSVPNAAPGANNAEAFAQVREFPAGYTFAFNSGATVAAAELGVNQICFECHKGRTGSTAVTTDPVAGTQVRAYSYLHYAPAMATLFGDESKMVPTYEGKVYTGRFVHPVANAAGSNEFGCVDCHDVHNTNGNHAASNKMTNPAYSCNSCHGIGSLSAANLQARTQAYSTRLLETILPAFLAANGTVGLNAGLQTFITTLAAEADPALQLEMLATHLEGRTNMAPNAAVAKAANVWKIFSYEDGAVHGDNGVHGHGGSWAHNSRFARQVMFDAIESLGGNLTGLSRP